MQKTKTKKSVLDKLGKDEEESKEIQILQKNANKERKKIEREKKRAEYAKRLGEIQEEKIKAMTPKQKVVYEKRMKTKNIKKKKIETETKRRENLKNAKMQSIYRAVERHFKSENGKNLEAKAVYKRRASEIVPVPMIRSGAMSVLLGAAVLHAEKIANCLKKVHDYSNQSTYSLDHLLFVLQYIK